MILLRRFITLLLLALGLTAHAADWTRHDTEYSPKGADTCLKCHDADSDTDTFTAAAIFKGKHAQRGNAHAPFGPGGLQCEACHGPGGRHSAGGSKKKLTTNSFKPDSFLPVAERNAACLACHQGEQRSAWHAGAHARSDVACTDCHKLHTGNDAVRTKASQPEVCFTCHKQQRADFHKTSAHPVKAGRMACSDCHDTHNAGSATAMLKRPTVTQTCQSCHADKRGPFLWEHAPAAEDCTQCHNAHGSVRNALLTKSPPLLCQQCHSVAGHPAVARTGAALPAASGGTAAGGSVFLLAGSCTNCHSQVHGSNHPAGTKLLR
ncbi:DmsE family decaheme c-type cytochrome [Aquincola sp. S2]|uniref:DmsE family decaheme c-type cytochrome n=1 Tax=Pseudaquabacterium terrae TaxID=2732868 RepID=A0ABX2EQW5_9BURK|nr:DmsE family decaheme c-type cytochrome [Aquabacterium terrae]NRF71074.1 DmsE family decaheme c-type cytochrome [Aquabacterium terrae]